MSVSISVNRKSASSWKITFVWWYLLQKMIESSPPTCGWEFGLDFYLSPGTVQIPGSNKTLFNLASTWKGTCKNFNKGMSTRQAFISSPMPITKTHSFSSIYWLEGKSFKRRQVPQLLLESPESSVPPLPGVQCMGYTLVLPRSKIVISPFYKHLKNSIPFTQDFTNHVEKNTRAGRKGAVLVG